jgi:hypothetical protein
LERRRGKNKEEQRRLQIEGPNRFEEKCISYIQQQKEILLPAHTFLGWKKITVANGTVVDRRPKKLGGEKGKEKGMCGRLTTAERPWGSRQCASPTGSIAHDAS